MPVSYGKTNVMWVQGYIDPTQSGEYYVALEAQEDIAGFKAGEVEVTTDYFHAHRGEWEQLGKDNPSWKVLFWAYINRPDVPADIAGKVREYFGVMVK